MNTDSLINHRDLYRLPWMRMSACGDDKHLTKEDWTNIGWNHIKQNFQTGFRWD